MSSTALSVAWTPLPVSTRSGNSGHGWEDSYVLQKMIRATILTLVVTFFSASAFAGEKPDEIDSHESAFHYMIHDGAAFCLVCYTVVEKKPWRGEWEQLEIQATIVEVFRGEKTVGDRIQFRRVMDGKFGDISLLHGSLRFVRFDRSEENAGGELSVDPQDPQAIFGYSAEFHAVARSHSNAEQADGGNQIQR